MEQTSDTPASFDCQIREALGTNHRVDVTNNSLNTEFRRNMWSNYKDAVLLAGENPFLSPQGKLETKQMEKTVVRQKETRL